MSSQAGPDLAARSPSSRKSLSAVTATKKHHAATRKRAKSIASTNPDDLTPRSLRRRSLAPKKSILKQSNVNSLPSLLPESSSTEKLSSQQPALEDTTMNFTRMSNITQDRRVSFAPNAHVRLIPKEPQNHQSSTPPSSPGDSVDSPAPSPDIAKENRQPSTEPSPLKNYKPSRRSSLRQSSGDGEVSMELASDASFTEDQSTESAEAGPSRRESGASEGSSMELDDSQNDMDITMNTNVTGRFSLASRPRRSSTRPRREPNESSEESPKPTEYTVTLEQSLRGEVEPSANWMALRALVGGGNEDEDEEAAATPAVDLDIETAAKRLLIAGEGIPVVAASSNDEEDMTISSQGDSTGSISGKTMDFTSITGGIRRASMKSVSTQPAETEAAIAPPVVLVSSVAPTTATNAETSPALAPPTPLARPNPTPAPSSVSRAQAGTPGSIFLSKPMSFVTPMTKSQLPVRASVPLSSPTKGGSSPVKSIQRPKPFTFAPPSAAKPKTPAFTMKVPSSITKSPARSTPLKRPHPAEEAVESPAKKLIVSVEGSSQVQAISRVPSALPEVAQPRSKSPQKSPQKNSGVAPRRPSEYLSRPSIPRPLSTPLVASLRTPSAKEKKSSEKENASPIKFPESVPSTPKPSTPQPSTPVQDKSVALTPVRTPVESETPQRTPQDKFTPQRTALPLSTPVRTPFRSEAIERPIEASPWLSKVKRQSVVSITNEDGEIDSTEVFLSEEARGRMPKSVDELLRLVGGEFMDNMAARRRSTMALRAKDQFSDTPATNADFATAMIIEYPQLSYYDFIMKHLNNHNDQLDEEQQETDRAVLENPPPVFIDYAEGGPEQLPELKAMLETLRSLVRTRTKLRWYKWRLEGVNDLYHNITLREKEALQDLALTKELAKDVSVTANHIEEEHALIMAELQREREAVAEIEKCDPKVLNEIKISISDQATQLKMVEGELEEAQTDINKSAQREDQYTAEQITLQKRMEQASRVCSSTNKDQNVVRETKEMVHLLERVSKWTASKISPKLVSLEYDQRFTVNIPCDKWIPKLESCQVGVKPLSNNERRRMDYLPTFTSFTAETAHELLVNGKFGRKSIKKIIHKLSSFWTCHGVIRQEIMMVRSKYAATLHRSEGKGLVLEVPILYEKSSAKIMAEFELNAKAIESWPLSVKHVKTRVNLCYSLDDVAINVDSIRTSIVDRLQQATLVENFGVFLEACVEADALYQ